MKKINLKSIKAEEILSREDLKKITGGDYGSGDQFACTGKQESAPCKQSDGNIGKCAYDLSTHSHPTLLFCVKT
ncbi:hypothetical protein [Sphingobacterium sp. GVS05A]|uniref:hypothetical protein n=1 Tax=Sphingobacterium sp. GVS05A TaxID=2862679 RepID=UPI001CBE7C87|nr:hypothetical protein [Sphingobacterium sp. GVS05A]